MAVAQGQNKSASSGGVVRLNERRRGESLWADAWKRLRRNRPAIIGGVIIILAVLMSIFADSIAPYSPVDGSLLNNNSAPEWVLSLFPSMKPIRDANGEPVQGGYVYINNDHAFGTDVQGRDLLSRIIHGARVSLAVAFVGPLVSLIVGITVGMIAGYVGGRVDNLLMRFVDIMYAFPTLLLIILLMAFFRSSLSETQPGSFADALSRLDASSGGMIFIFIGVGLTSWMNLARLVRGQILAVREKEFIEAARSLGTGTRGIMFRHMLPNILGPIIVAETLTIPVYIRYEAFLSFIGLGVNAPTPSWGAMISEGQNAIATYPNQVLFPAAALFIVMFAFNFLGDGLRDALDPRMRGVD